MAYPGPAAYGGPVARSAAPGPAPAAPGPTPHSPPTADPPPGTVDALRVPAFRSLWTAQLASNTGTWMQTVAAQWMLVHQPNAPALTAAAQAASLLPVLFVSLPAGVLADVLDKRRYLVATEAAMAAVAALLAVVTWTGQTTPALLLVLTFALGIGAAAANPAWQAVQPDLVERDLLPAAAALNSASVNVARAVGPAIAGAILLGAGPGVVFGINALTFVWVVVALVRWRSPARPATAPEPVAPALVSGVRYVQHAPGVRRVLLRSGLFVVPASALWALLAVVASGSLHLGPGGYGLMLAALGTGAVGGTLVLGPLRARVSTGVLLATGSVLFALGMLACALVRVVPVVVAALVVAGAGWVVVLATFSTTLQLVLPAWVRARALAAYLVVFMGGQGVGALVWGAVADRVGVSPTLVVAGALVALAAATLALWPLRPTALGDRGAQDAFAEPTLAAPVPPDAGPVAVEVEYHVRPEDLAAFLAAAVRLEASRRRTGASSWSLLQDAAWPEVLVERFTVPTWGEHLRQHHERTTGWDAEANAAVAAFDIAAGAGDQVDVGALHVRHLVPPRPPTEGADGGG